MNRLNKDKRSWGSRNDEDEDADGDARMKVEGDGELSSGEEDTAPKKKRPSSQERGIATVFFATSRRAIDKHKKNRSDAPPPSGDFPRKSKSGRCNRGRNLHGVSP